MCAIVSLSPNHIQVDDPWRPGYQSNFPVKVAESQNAEWPLGTHVFAAYAVVPFLHSPLPIASCKGGGGGGKEEGRTDVTELLLMCP